MVGKEELVEIKRDWASRLKCDQQGYPLPVVLIGEGQAWDNGVHEVCPACKGNPLPPSAYCLRCDSWGLDWANWERYEAMLRSRARV